ncbi:MAG: sigma-70 family RNA polymerase sigma factor [Myxococcales bacterium]|nr:sigma-70 family RNA polymerase sigma factor [Myxococcales bacterium]
MSPTDTVVEAFVRAVPPERGPVTGSDAVAAALGRSLERAAAAWPDLVVPADEFAAWLGARLPGGAEPAVALDELRVEDLYLACACARADPRAIAALEHHHGPGLQRALSRVSDPHLRPEDLAQIVRHKLLVGDETSDPVIAQYAGQGGLGAWLRVVGLRTAFNATRRKQPQLGERRDVASELDEVAEQLDDPELGYIRERYQAQFREAFAEAAGALGSRPRNLLRQAVVHGLSVRELGRMYGVHYATASRWLAEARRTLVAGTRERLRGRLEVSEDELQSIMRLIGSDFDITLARVLRTMG